MCRSKELGGRRCSSHSDPIKLAAYNAHRREVYAANKNPKPVFKLMNEVVYSFDESSENWSDYTTEADAYANILSAHLDGRKLFSKLDYYTAHGFRDIRNYLNGYNVASIQQEKLEYDEAEKEDFDETVKFLDAAIALAPKPDQHRRVYRGMDVPANILDEHVGEWVDKSFPVGSIISQKSYMSTTRSASKAGYTFVGHENNRAVIFEILSKQGAVLGRGTSTFGYAESEVLMPRNAKFKIVGVHKEAPVRISLKGKRSEAAEAKALAEPRTVIQLIDAGDDE